MPLRAVFEDRALLGRVVRAVQLDQNCDFVTALDQLHAGTDHAMSLGGGTLREALEWVGDDEYLAQSLRTLERRDAVVESAQKRDLDEQPDLRRDQMGRVFVNQGDGTTTDIGAALSDPVERERRFQRARHFDARYEAPVKGRGIFDLEDRVHLESGVDLVKSLEAPPGQRDRIAQQQTNVMVQALDQAIAAGADKRQRLKLLDAEIAKLEGPTLMAREAVGAQLRAEVAETDRGIVRMLDQLSGDQPDDHVRTLDVSQLQVLDSSSLYDRIHRHMEANGLPQTHFAKLLDQYTTTGTLPETPAPAEPEVPRGVHPGLHQIDQRVRDRMRELDAPESDYVKVLEQVMKGNV